MPKKRRMHPILGEIDEENGPTAFAGDEPAVLSPPIEPEDETDIIRSPNPPPAPHKVPMRARAKQVIKTGLLKVVRRIIKTLEEE